MEGNDGAFQTQKDSRVGSPWGVFHRTKGEWSADSAAALCSAARGSVPAEKQQGRASARGPARDAPCGWQGSASRSRGLRGIGGACQAAEATSPSVITPVTRAGPWCGTTAGLGGPAGGQENTLWLVKVQNGTWGFRVLFPPIPLTYSVMRRTPAKHSVPQFPAYKRG